MPYAVCLHIEVKIFAISLFGTRLFSTSKAVHKNLTLPSDLLLLFIAVVNWNPFHTESENLSAFA
jgi:hypothetical protein